MSGRRFRLSKFSLTTRPSSSMCTRTKSTFFRMAEKMRFTANGHRFFKCFLLDFCIFFSLSLANLPYRGDSDAGINVHVSEREECHTLHLTLDIYGKAAYCTTRLTPPSQYETPTYELLDRAGAQKNRGGFCRRGWSCCQPRHRDNPRR